MRFLQRIVACAGAAAMIAALAACGGGSTSGGGTGPPPVSSVTVAPSAPALTIGVTQQFTATVNGPRVTDTSVSWSVGAPAGSSLSPGTIDSTGLYTTPYPAPASVTVTATSNQDKSVSGSATVNLSPPAKASGPALTVDAASQTHPINPLIYGMNGWQLSSTTGKAAHITVDRFGGDATSRYNYQLDVTSSASDWYFENNLLPGGTGQENTGAFNQQVAADEEIGAKTLGTVPVNGWVARNSTACSFPVSTYPDQQEVDNGRGCGNGVYPQGTHGCTSPSGCDITGNDPRMTSKAIDGPAWASAWVKYLVGKFGSAAKGGVAIYDLDNEPSWWDAVHRDVHPKPFTYDEVTKNGIAVAAAIKSADPTAEVSGPVIDYWWAYFYSKKDIESGWGTGPCYEPWGDPADRTAHGGVPLIEYYLQQFAAAEQITGKRLLDYLDLHTYFVADDPQNPEGSLGFAPAGNTVAQQARLNSTRVFWDPAYTDPNYPQPNYSTDANYTANCTVPLQAPKVIPMMRNWAAKNYPETKLAITEYNWGGQEHINGALAQADILGIFGREGLDLGTLWGAPDPVKQIPGLMAFEVFRNYDGKGAVFGDVALSAKSANQGHLSIYGALRTADQMVTIVVINKTYGDLTATLAIENLSAATTSAKAYLYSNANLKAIVPQSMVTVTPPDGSTPASSISTTFPAQSITLLVMPD